MAHTVTHTVTVEGKLIPLTVKNNRRAKRISLRLNQSQRLFVLTLPNRVSLKRGLAFVNTKEEWLLRNWQNLPNRTPFADGETIPFLGHELTIHHQPAKRGVVEIDGDRLLVSGDARHLKRRLTDWLKAEARRLLTHLAEQKAAELHVTVKRITVRDTQSRWGSCSAKGNLSFSWRLIFASQQVVEYIVAHEVAHLKEMNHGPRFWRLVEKLCPGYEKHVLWLRKHGGKLHLIG